MNATPLPPEDSELRRLLQEAHPVPALPPRFQEGVWRRLEQEELRLEEVSPRTWLDRWVQQLFRPGFAVAGLAALMLTGGWLGLRSGDTRVQQMEQTRYLASVSPFHRSMP